jgi:hypothetical protein
MVVEGVSATADAHVTTATTPVPADHRRPTGRYYAFVFGLGLLRLFAGLSLGFRPFDDAYITFRYALNLSAGYGFVYNVGDPVLGTTSPLWAFLLALLHLGRVPIETASLVGSLIFDIGSALMIFRLLSRLGYSSSIAFASSCLFLGLFDYFSLARSGMESAMFVFLAVATLEAAASSRFPLAGLLCGFACLARPEGAILIGALAVLLWRRREALNPAGLLKTIGLFLVVTACWTAYAVWVFGSVLPQSMVAKAATSGQPGLARFSWSNLALFFLKGQYGGEVFDRTYLQLMPAATILGGIACLGLLRDASRRRAQAVDRLILLLAFPSLYVGVLAAAHAFTFFPWYYAPVYPFLAMLAMIGASHLERAPGSIVVRIICTTLLAGQLGGAHRQTAQRSNVLGGGLFTSCWRGPARRSHQRGRPRDRYGRMARVARKRRRSRRARHPLRRRYPAS